MRISQMITELSEHQQKGIKVVDGVSNLRVERNCDATPDGAGVYITLVEDDEGQMSVANILKFLKDIDDDKLQVKDFDGSRIAYIVNKGKSLRFEPFSQMDIESFLEGFFEQSEDMEENDVFYELGEYGLTLLDVYGTKYYEMFYEMSQAIAWEE